MSTTRGLICAVAIGMLAAGVAFPASGATNTAAQRPHKGQGFGGRFMAKCKQLNLTADQSQQIESIVKLNQESMKAAMTKAKETREALNRQIQAGPFDEQSVREACKKAAAAGEEAAVLRAKIAGQIRAVLTGEQQAALNKIRAEARSTMHKRFAKERGTTDK
ncbi:MAG: Spy/CpxP family protein refolding chaperone [Kiritimatiellae bacterium]|nr:Spy/CpxP family protein refolding chaperone [Verrucomicrobiota bacterium]MCG2660295.1 Spy/CpxP family protein refolding chaperone [Kiritimatiellia bacterium]